MATRRGNGEGSIRRLETGKYEGSIRLGKQANGRPRRGKVIRGSHKEVRDALDDLLAKHEAGVHVRRQTDPTVAWLLQYWIESVRATDYPQPSPKTLAGYRTDTAQYLTPSLGHLRVSRLTPDDVRRCWTAMQRRGLAAGSIAHARRTLSAALTWAVEEKLRTDNPVPKPTRSAAGRKQNQATIDPLTAAESLRVLTCARCHRNAARWRIALALGLRQGEVLALQLDDLDLDAATLLVRRQVQRIAWRHGCTDPDSCRHHRTGKKARGVDCPRRLGPGGLVVRDLTKSGKDRLVPLSAAMVAELRLHLDALAAEREVVGCFDTQGGGWLFPTPFGKITDPRADYQQWRDLLDEAKVRRARLHDARHTAATGLLNRGLDPVVVRELFGWSSPAMTARYAHPQDEHRQALAAAMDDALPALPPILRAVE